VKPFENSLSRLWLLISMKLGRCPYCMRASARGTLAAWVALGIVSLVWSHSMLHGLALLVALGFTALLLAHMAAFTWRAVPHVVRSIGWPPAPQHSAERREFLGEAMKVGATAVALSLLSFGRVVLVRADTNRCKTQRLNQFLSASGSDTDEAKRNLELQARTFCDDLCRDKWCAPSTKTCKLISVPSFERKGGLELGACSGGESGSSGGMSGVSCVAFLHLCDCDCEGDFISPNCAGPNVFDVTAEGATEEEARANLLEQAVADCSAVCSKKDQDCEARNRFCVSRSRGYQVGIRRCDPHPKKSGVFICTGRVICPCECAKEF